MCSQIIRNSGEKMRKATKKEDKMYVRIYIRTRPGCQLTYASGLCLFYRPSAKINSLIRIVSYITLIGM